MISSECNGCEYQCKLSHIDICTLGSPCPHQRSTPMTNEEWFCQLSTEEKADFLAQRDFDKWDNVNSKKESKKQWLVWLKQPHTIKE